VRPPNIPSTPITGVNLAEIPGDVGSSRRFGKNGEEWGPQGKALGRGPSQGE